MHSSFLLMVLIHKAFAAFNQIKFDIYGEIELKIIRYPLEVVDIINKKSKEDEEKIPKDKIPYAILTKVKLFREGGANQLSEPEYNAYFYSLVSADYVKQNDYFCVFLQPEAISIDKQHDSNCRFCFEMAESMLYTAHNQSNSESKEALEPKAYKTPFKFGSVDKNINKISSEINSNSLLDICPYIDEKQTNIFLTNLYADKCQSIEDTEGVTKISSQGSQVNQIMGVNPTEFLYNALINQKIAEVDKPKFISKDGKTPQDLNQKTLIVLDLKMLALDDKGDEKEPNNRKPLI